MNDLVHVLSKLTDSHGRILIPGVLDSVTPFTEQERARYNPIDFDVEAYKADVGVQALHNRLRFETKQDLLRYRWREPSLSIHGIEGAFSESGTKTVLPAKVTGKFSIRLVPNQEPAQIEQAVHSYILAEFERLRSPNRIRVHCSASSKAWLADPDGPNYVAGRNAIRRLYGVEPDLTREGGSIPVTLTFQEATGKSVMLLPIGASDDGQHSQNEKINRSNYIMGIKLLALYLDELARVPL